MNCDDILRCLDEYLDSGLSPAEAHEVRAHLKQCAACRDVERGTRAVLNQAAALPKALPPQRNLWQGIAERIDRPAAFAQAPRRVAWRPRILSMAAVVVLCVALAYAPRPTRAPGANTHRPPALSTVVHAAELEYCEARTELMAAIDARGGALSSETMQTVEESLRLIDDAVAEIRVALEDDPENPQLMRMLMATHEKGLNLLGKAARLPDQG